MSRDLEVKTPGFECWSCCFAAVWPKHITASFNLGFLICKMPTLILRDTEDLKK